MTRDEIRLVVFMLLAVALGSTVKWWREQRPQKPVVIQTEERKSGWTDPPYVFKSGAAMDQLGAEVKKGTIPPRSEMTAEPSHAR